MEINCNLIKYIKVTDNVMPKPVLESLLKVCKDSQSFGQGHVLKKNDHVVDKEMRNTFVWPMNNLGEKSLTTVHWANYLSFLFGKAITDYNNIYNIYGRFNISEIQILKYLEGGFYKFHVDNDLELPRTYSCILFLNDNYEGGDLIFKFPGDNNEHKIKTKKNSVVVWPSNFLYPHSVSPVVKGERYSVVSWAR